MMTFSNKSTQTDKKLKKMQEYHEELIHELAKHSKSVDEKTIYNFSHSFFGSSKGSMKNLSHKSSSSN